ncbi:MAG: CDP-glycerol glycerophosphotransferase family protein, partial [Calditrichia bacterium]
MCYCQEPLDYEIFKNIQPFLPPIPIVTARKYRANFMEKGITPQFLPCFPKAVIMFRHAVHKFPEEKIIKIGLRHGAYHFKKLSSAGSYNKFDVFLMTSSHEVQVAQSTGISTGRAVGFPKLDPLFNGKLSDEILESYRRKVKLNKTKKTVLFTATWDGSGMSAAETWIPVLPKLVDSYNVMVSVHPWSSAKLKKRIRNQPGIYFIQDADVVPYLALADIMVGDTSSVIAEFCALNKPIITVQTGEA